MGENIIIMTLSLLKFSSKDCGTCHRMSNYDSKVAIELGFDFIDIKLQDIDVYKKYRHILLKQYPNKEGMGWPTYLLVDNCDSKDFVILGEVKGGMPKGDFRNKLNTIVDN